MARPKIKTFWKICILSRIFSIIFQFLLILMHIFEKLPQILGLCPIVKFRSTSKNRTPSNIFWTPLNRKILHKLLLSLFPSSTFEMWGLRLIGVNLELTWQPNSHFLLHGDAHSLEIRLRSINLHQQLHAGRI